MSKYDGKLKDKLRQYFHIYALAELFQEIYPEDLFPDQPKDIKIIRDQFKNILERRADAEVTP